MKNIALPNSEPKVINTLPSRCNTFSIQNNHREYDFTQCLNWMYKAGLFLYGPKFLIHPEDIVIYKKLLAYFIQDKGYCEKHNIDLEKGILLTGPVGCGKTTIMNLMNFFIAYKRRFVFRNCRELSYQFSTEGYPLIIRIGGNRQMSNNTSYCFDDLGAEKIVRFYGNDCNVMGELILSRYELWSRKKIFSHFTSNLSAPEIEERYGIRARSRLRAMVNLLSFDQNSKDKRA